MMTRNSDRDQWFAIYHSHILRQSSVLQMQNRIFYNAVGISVDLWCRKSNIQNYQEFSWIQIQRNYCSVLFKSRKKKHKQSSSRVCEMRVVVTAEFYQMSMSCVLHIKHFPSFSMAISYLHLKYLYLRFYLIWLALSVIIL